MPSQGTKKQKDQGHKGQRGGQSNTQTREETSRGQQGTSNQAGQQTGTQQTIRPGENQGQRGTQQQTTPATNRGKNQNDYGQTGGPGPHGSSDPQTDERNKNKPLTDDWGKGDKH